MPPPHVLIQINDGEPGGPPPAFTVIVVQNTPTVIIFSGNHTLKEGDVVVFVPLADGGCANATSANPAGTISGGDLSLELGVTVQLEVGENGTDTAAVCLAELPVGGFPTGVPLSTDYVYFGHLNAEIVPSTPGPKDPLSAFGDFSDLAWLWVVILLLLLCCCWWGFIFLLAFCRRMSAKRIFADMPLLRVVLPLPPLDDLCAQTDSNPSLSPLRRRPPPLRCVCRRLASWIPRCVRLPTISNLDVEQEILELYVMGPSKVHSVRATTFAELSPSLSTADEVLEQAGSRTPLVGKSKTGASTCMPASTNPRATGSASLGTSSNATTSSNSEPKAATRTFSEYVV